MVISTSQLFVTLKQLYVAETQTAASWRMRNCCSILTLARLILDVVGVNTFMLTTQQLTTILRQQLPYLSAQYGIKRLGLFGSYAKGVQREYSDIDLVAEFESPPGLKFIEFTDYLEQLLHAPVDVLTPAGIQAIRNAQVAQAIRESIVYV